LINSGAYIEWDKLPSINKLAEALDSNRHVPVSARVEDLLPRMTVEGKVAQVIGVKAMKTIKKQ
jgi:hypothetical protein